MALAESQNFHSRLHSGALRPSDEALLERYPLTPGLVRLIEHHLHANGLEPKVIGSSRSSLRRTWFYWKEWVQDGGKHHVTRAKLEAIASLINIDHAILKTACLVDFELLEGIAREVDEHLLRLIRAAEGLSQDELAEDYDNLLVGCLAKHRLHPTTFIALLDQIATDSSTRNRLPAPDLLVDVADDFTSIIFACNGVSPLRVRRPQLLWDCCCPAWPKRIGRVCRIHSNPSGAAIARAFGQARVEIRWRGLSVRWRNRPELWPPSVDTFRMMNALRDDRRIATSSSILDLGSGTGMLGLFAASRASKKAPVTLDLADWLLTPALYGAANFAINREHLGECTPRFRIGMMKRWIEAEQSNGPSMSDLVLCNPPYLPAFQPFRWLGQHSAVISTDLLEDVISNASSYGKHVFVQYSSVADREALRAARRGGVRLAPVGKDRLVPFRVSVALSERPYIAALLHRGGLRRGRKDGHRFWHTLRLRRLKGRPKTR